MKAKPLIIEIYKDVDRQWRWRFLRRAFGKTLIVADSAEAYHNRKDCEQTLVNLLRSIRETAATIRVSK